jgi:hypothetical protein
MVAWQPVGIAMGVYDVCHRYALLFFVVNLSTIHFVIAISPFTTDLLHFFFCSRYLFHALHWYPAVLGHLDLMDPNSVSVAWVCVIHSG